MIKNASICFEFNVPVKLPFGKYRQAMAVQLRERYPTICLTEDKVVAYEDVVLEMFPSCGCRTTLLLSEVPLESLRCSCGKSYYIKINKVKA